VVVGAWWIFWTGMRFLSDYVDEDTTLEDFWREVAGQLIERVIQRNNLILALPYRDALRTVIRTLYTERERQLAGTFRRTPMYERRYNPVDSNIPYNTEDRWYQTVWMYVEDMIGEDVFEIAEDIRAREQGGDGYHLENELLELCPSVITDILWAITSRIIPESFMVEGENYSDDDLGEDPPEEPER